MRNERIAKVELVVYGVGQGGKVMGLFVGAKVEVRDMEPLPPRDQRHLWLRYQVEGYTEEIVHDFKQRIKTIYGRQVNRVHMLDFKGLTPDMRQDLAERLRMVYTRDDGQEVFVSHAWRRLFKIRAPLVYEFLLEFFSTCRIKDEMGLDAAGSERVIPDKGDLSDHWVEISSGRDFLRGAPSYTYIKDPVQRLCHRFYQERGGGKDDDIIIAIEATILWSLEQRVIVGGIVKDAMILLFKAASPVYNKSRHLENQHKKTMLQRWNGNNIVDMFQPKSSYFRTRLQRGAKPGQPDFKLNGVNKPKTLALKPPTADSAATSSTSQDTEDAIAITTGKNKVTVCSFMPSILCLDQHAHTLHHLESLLTISLDTLDILKEDLVYQSLRNWNGIPPPPYNLQVYVSDNQQIYVDESVFVTSSNKGFAAALAVLVTGVSQSRQHSKSESNSYYLSD
ncbi:hypothetical protein Tco_0359624 [Tanacetum coccineum]